MSNATKGFDCSAVIGTKQLQVLAPYSDQVKVLIRYINRQQFSDILERAAVAKFVDGSLKSEFDNILFGELLGDAAIIDWFGCVADGVPIPCTSENKRTFMRNWMAFAKFISSTCVDLDRLVALDQEKERKNFESSSVPEQITQG